MDRSLSENQKSCWVCFATEEDDTTAPWVTPCKCRGTTKWVHQSCLQRWVDEKQKGNPQIKVSCPQCGMQYIILFPNMGHLMQFFDKIDAVVQKLCPFMAACVIIGSCYWVAVTYGAVTVMQVVGYHKGMSIMENTEPMVLLFGLPTIPILLILSKMVRWEERLITFIRASVSESPILQYILPSFRCDTAHSDQPVNTTATFSDPINATRLLCGALSLPTFSTMVGKTFFPWISSTFSQTLVGAFSFLFVKGLLKVYYKQQQHVMKRNRKIKDNPEHQNNVRNRSNLPN